MNYTNNYNDSIKLTFASSLDVDVYPCGRRKGRIDNNNYIPFDPEARLNTEANNRKYSSLNGFTQTYLNSIEDGLISLVLSGYLFSIKFNNNRSTPADSLGTEIFNALGQPSDGTKIYANILTENTQLFSSAELSYRTEILRNQSDDSGTPNSTTNLDLLVPKSDADANYAQNSGNYYFSGISFSTAPLTGEEYKESTKSVKPIYRDTANSILDKRIVSLCILEKKSEGWAVYQPALLPNIEHGENENSIVVGEVEATEINAANINIEVNRPGKEAELMPVAVLEVVPDGSSYQLRFWSN